MLRFLVLLTIIRGLADDADLGYPRAHVYDRLCRILISDIRRAADMAKKASTTAYIASNMVDDDYMYRLTRYYSYEANRIYEAGLFDATFYERNKCSSGLRPLIRTIRLIRKTSTEALEVASRGTRF